MKKIVLLILVLLAVQAVAQETGLGGLSNAIEKNRKEIASTKIEVINKLETYQTDIDAKITGVYARIALLIISAHLLILSLTKIIGGITQWLKDRKQIKQRDQTLTKLDRIIEVLDNPKALEILEKAKEIQATKVKRELNKVELFIAIMIGVVIGYIVIAYGGVI